MVSRQNKKPVMALGFGILSLLLFWVFRQRPTELPQENLGVLVDTVAARKSDVPIEISATGTVEPKQRVNVSTEINGRVISINDAFVEGGFIKKDTPIFRIDDRDYLNEVEVRRSDVLSAEEQLETIKARAQIAGLEWKVMKGATAQSSSIADGVVDMAEPSALALFGPQLKNAEGKLLAARARLSQAELAFQRTTVFAPFNCIVISKRVDVGQYIKSGDVAAEVYGTDVAKIVVSILADEARWISAARKESQELNLPARVYMSVGSNVLSWNGRMRRFLGEVDSRTRMVQAVVEVDEPYSLSPTANGRRNSALLMGSFVQVVISDVGMLNGVFVIPRLALRQGSTTWVVNGENVLDERRVEVARFMDDEVVISSGLEEGDRVVITNIAGASSGLRLRVREPSS